MRVWFVTVGEPLECDGPDERLMRTALLEREFVRRGHDVTRWTSTFNHSLKEHRFTDDEVRQIGPRHRIILLRSTGYRRHVSLRRVLDHQILAAKLLWRAPRESRPDLVVASLPTLELCAVAADYARSRGVPFVVDVRDLWPDVFTEVVPPVLRPPARVAVAPFTAMARFACCHASAITAINRSFVDWGVRLARRVARDGDRAFPLACSIREPTPDAIESATEFWRGHGVAGKAQDFTVCFIGTFGRHFDVGVVIRAAAFVRESGRPMRFVLCGTGEGEADLRRAARGVDGVVMPGWVDATKIWTLLRMSSVGVAPYRSTPSFEPSIPNKVIEYLSAGLPVVSSLRGEVENLLLTESCGFHYADEDAPALASLLVGLAARPSTREAMSQRARRVFDTRFVAELVYGEMAAHLESVAGLQRRRGEDR